MTDYKLKENELECYLFSGRDIDLMNLKSMVRKGYIMVDSVEYNRLMKLIKARITTDTDVDFRSKE